MKLYTIGKIVGAQGLKGEVKVYPETTFPERFLEMGKVLIGSDDTQKLFKIVSARIHKNVIILDLEGIITRNDADALIGKVLYVTENELYELPEDHYYIFDLIGLLVIDRKFGQLGTIKNVIEGPQDLYVIEPSSQSPAKEEFYIPAVKVFIEEIDLETKEMLVDLPEGLW
ncbi:MAG: ribosome maturation factor RimM [Firmicutes bacterium]|nr:ribosome maturation factor RimM [Bacillota bacterium]MDD4263690.1 ribosome maturation factor RimM [Bacillota bacterium]MDD4693540.1 ribosome maturation factor RimM [Bacillota bacterium]